MKNLLVPLFIFITVLVTGEGYNYSVTTYSDRVHIEVLEINDSCPTKIEWRDGSTIENGGTLNLDTNAYDQHNGHTVYKENRSNSTEVRLIIGTNTTPWFTL